MFPVKLALAALVLTAPLGAQAPVTTYTPETAIAAAASTRDGVGGLFVMTVGSAAKAGRVIYLNSERDYRAPGNLTVVIAPALIDDVTKFVGGDPVTRLEGRTIRVAGVAKPAPVKKRGDDDDKVLYTQTRIQLYDIGQLELID